MSYRDDLLKAAKDTEHIARVQRWQTMRKIHQVILRPRPPKAYDDGAEDVQNLFCFFLQELALPLHDGIGEGAGMVVIVVLVVLVVLVAIVVIVARAVQSSNFIDPDGNGDVVIRRLEVPRVRQSCQRLLPCRIWRGMNRGLRAREV